MLCLWVHGSDGYSETTILYSVCNISYYSGTDCLFASKRPYSDHLDYALSL
jgi:hypothetical protein